MFKKSVGVKYNYKVTFGKCTGLKPDSYISINWKRGRKDENRGETMKKKAINGEAEWNETITMVCTLIRSGKGASYDEKEMVITLNDFDTQKNKTSALASERINLSDFASSGGAAVKKDIKFRSKKDKSHTYNLSITVWAESAGE